MQIFKFNFRNVLNRSRCRVSYVVCDIYKYTGVKPFTRYFQVWIKLSLIEILLLLLSI